MNPHKTLKKVFYQGFVSIVSLWLQVTTVLKWMLVDAFVYVKEENEMKQQRQLVELHSLISDVSFFFAKSDNFWIVEEYFSVFLFVWMLFTM